MAQKKVDQILFTPGPVGVRPEILKKLSEPVMFHRTKPLQEVHKAISQKLIKFFGGNNEFVPILITGSGTLANEIALSSLIDKKSKALLLSNGHFAERIEEIAKIHKLNIKTLDFGWTNKIEPHRVEREIKKYKPKVVIMVALETSTGMINPVSTIGKLCKKYNVTFFVDGVSAIGGENIKVARDNVDVCVSVPNKALEAPPGLSFICVNKKLLDSKLPKPSSYYMDIKRYYSYLSKYQMPTSPAVSLMVGLNKALDLFMKETLTGRIKRYKTNSQIVESKATKLGMRLLLGKEDRANGIATFYLPSSHYAEELSNYLLSKNMTVWHHDYEKLDKPLQAIMQISIMGNINKTEVNKLFRVISTFVDSHPLKY